MAVNAYLVWDPATRVAAAFDTGADSREMVRSAKHHKLDVQLILLTHAHPDHVADLPGLREETGADVFTPAREPVPGAEPIEEGKKFRLGNLQIDTRLTWGHSPGGMTYVVTGLARPIADRWRFAFCRLDGRRQRVVSRCLTKQPRENSDLAGRNHHLPRTRPDDHSGRGETAQPVLCWQSLKKSELSPQINADLHHDVTMLNLMFHPCASVANFSS